MKSLFVCHQIHQSFCLKGRAYDVLFKKYFFTPRHRYSPSCSSVNLIVFALHIRSGDVLELTQQSQAHSGGPLLSEPLHSSAGTAQGCWAAVRHHFCYLTPQGVRVQEKGRQFISLPGTQPSWHRKGILHGSRSLFILCGCRQVRWAPWSQLRGQSSGLHCHWLPRTDLNFLT